MSIEMLKNEAEKIGIELDEYALERFELYQERLIRWNMHMNLTAITEPFEIAIKHFLDSLFLLKYLDVPYGSSLIDVGSGAGFPGIPVLIARPDIEMLLADSSRKRIGFIKEVLHLTGLCAYKIHERAEILGREEDCREMFDFATARAVAPLNVLCEYCLPFVKVGGIFAAMKGPEDESERASNAIDVLGGKLIDNVSYELPTGEKRRIIMIKKISQTPTKYPRKIKKIDNKPL